MAEAIVPGVSERVQVIDGIGERGKDFLEVWMSPESPNESLRDPGNPNAMFSFANGIYIVRPDNEAAGAAMEMGAPSGHYLKADPLLKVPWICEEPLCHCPIWYSQAAFTRHYKFAHSGGTARARR